MTSWGKGALWTGQCSQSNVYFPNAPLLPVYAYSRPIKITWKVRRSPFWEASHLPVLGMTIYFGIQELRDVLKFREFLGKAARSCQKCKFQISNVRTPFRNDRTNLRCLHSQDNVSQSSKSLSNISTYLAFCIVPSMLLACWHKCPLVKILSKIYQDVQRNVFTKQFLDADPLTTVFKYSHYGQPVIGQ